MYKARFSLLLGGAVLTLASCGSVENTPTSSGGAGGGASSGTGGSPSTTPPAPTGSGGSGGAGGGAAGGGSGGSNRDAGGPRADVPAGAPSTDASAERPPVRAPDGGAGRADGPAGNALFSFFYTSVEAMRRLSGSQNGFGGNLSFGGATGLAGADRICQSIAEGEGFGNKTWHAFLSAVRGPTGQQVDAIDRVGEGPWYDRNGRLIASNKAGLIAGNRPAGDAQAVGDLADEKGRGRPATGPNDTHDAITGSNTMGRLRFPGNLLHTCQDWTSAATDANNRPTVGFGHAWPSAASGVHWIQVHTGRSCVAGVNLVQGGGGDGSSIGAGGGYGGIYCFAVN